MILSESDYTRLMDAIYDTPIFQEVRAEHEAAGEAGYVWHEHWRLQRDLDQAAEYEAQRAYWDYEEDFPF